MSVPSGNNAQNAAPMLSSDRSMRLRSFSSVVLVRATLMGAPNISPNMSQKASIFFLLIQDGAHLSNSPKSLGLPTSMHQSAKSPSRYGMPVRQSAAGSRVIIPYSGHTCLRGTSSTPSKRIPSSSRIISPNCMRLCPQKRLSRAKSMKSKNHSFFSKAVAASFSLPSLPTKRNSFCRVLPFRWPIQPVKCKSTVQSV